MVAILALALLSASLVAAHPHPFSQVSETRSAALPRRWYHDEDHPTHALFRRQPLNVKRDDPSPDVGSPTWSAQYPEGSPDPSKLPKAWTDALTDAIAAGKIPNIPPSTSDNGGAPEYPAGVNENRNSAGVCAATDRVCRVPEDIWDAPTGFFGVGFDDGPTGASPKLYEFLEQQNQSSTHYMIGVNVRSYWQEFNMAYEQLQGDIAVHTWTHPFMTTQTNEQVLGQLGWTIQIIHDMTGGKIPRFWRPPFGDIDARVSAIGREVFGMTAMMWNQDTEDWSMSNNPPATTLDKIQSDMTQWLTGPKQPGLIILEHELTNDTIQAFISAYPLIAQNGWKAVSQAQLNDSIDTYQDGDEDDEAFNSLIPSSSTSQIETAVSATSASESVSASSTKAASAQANTSDAPAGFVFPSLVSLGLLVGAAFAFM